MFELAQATAIALANYGTLAIPALGLLLGAVLSLYLGLSRPHITTLFYLTPLFFFSMSNYGALEEGRLIWSRGSGLLFLPIVVWALLGIYTLTALSNSFNQKPSPSTQLHPWFLAWGALLAGHLIVAFYLGESMSLATHQYGFRNMVFAGVLFALLLRAFDTTKSIDLLIRFTLACVIARGIYGVVRFLFLGGDPSNIYANSAGINVKLTFFDINDSLVATLALFLSAWALTTRWRELIIWQRLFFLAVSAIEIFVIVFSYRRTAWGGLLLVALLFLWLLPARKRFIAALVGLPVALAGVAYAATQRLGTRSGGAISNFFHEFASSKVGSISQREYELHLGWQTFFDNPVLGVGSWGSYHTGFAQISWQQGENAFAFLHSGVLHILVKTGLLGFTLLFGLTVGFLHFIIKQRKRITPEWLGLYYAGLAGFLFLLPTWFLGTPVPEYRTTQLFAFCLALPFLAHRASNQIGKP